MVTEFHFTPHLSTPFDPLHAGISGRQDIMISRFGTHIEPVDVQAELLLMQLDLLLTRLDLVVMQLNLLLMRLDLLQP